MKQQTFASFENYQFHDKTNSEFECFCTARDHKILAGNYKSFARNSETAENFKIMTLMTSNKF